MAIATTMNLTNVDINSCSRNDNSFNNDNNKQQHHHRQQQQQAEDEHEHDMVMPGFRFHPTEEELVEFYLRRKIEGKKFNVELITFLDLYRYDPWELPGIYISFYTSHLFPLLHFLLYHIYYLALLFSMDMTCRRSSLFRPWP